MRKVIGFMLAGWPLLFGLVLMYQDLGLVRMLMVLGIVAIFVGSVWVGVGLMFPERRS